MAPRGQKLNAIGEAADTLALRAKNVKDVADEIARLRRPGGTKTEKRRKEAQLRPMDGEYREAVAGVKEAIKVLETRAGISDDLPTYKVNVEEFAPHIGSTIVVKLPKSTHPEVFDHVQKWMRQKYPDNKIICLHEDATIEEVT